MNSLYSNFVNKDVLLIIISSLIFSLYLTTISNSIAGGDAGEIVAEGYPLITLLIYGLTKLPTTLFGIGFGSVAYRVNIFCSICTSIATFFIGKIVLILCEEDLSAAIFGMAMFAFSPLIWQYAITAEVFALNTLFAAFILYLVIYFSYSKKIKIVYLGAFICGLGLCNQHSIVLYEIPLILWMLFLIRRYIIVKPYVLIYLLIIFIIGLLPYIYLPISAIFKPTKGSWGTVKTISGFIHHFLRRDYGTFQLYSGRNLTPVEGLWERNQAYLSDLTNQFGDLYIPTMIATIIGILYSILIPINGFINTKIIISNKSIINNNNKNNKSIDNKNNKSINNNSNDNNKLLNDDNSFLKDSIDFIDNNETIYTPLIFIITQIFYFFIFHSLSNMTLKDKLLYGVHQRFWMQPNVLLFIWSGIGFYVIKKIMINTFIYIIQIFTFIKNNNKKLKKNDESQLISISSNEIMIRSIHIITIIVSLIVIFIQYWKSLPLLNMSPYEHFRNYASAILNPLPKNAILLVNYDQQWTSIRYLQVCEGYRDDIIAIQLSMMTYKWFTDKRELYSNLTFPGTYYTFEGSPAQRNDNAFTLKQFLDSNINKYPIYLAGKLNYKDETHNMNYDLIPIGLVSQFRKKSDQLNVSNYFNKELLKSWSIVWKSLDLEKLPKIKQFPEETWEWTIGRDFKDRIEDTAAFLLEKSLEEINDSKPLIEAAYWLESIYLVEKEQSEIIPSFIMKNAGIAFMHMVRRDSIVNLTPPKKDLFKTIANKNITWPIEDKNWKNWAGSRFIYYWGEFLKHPNAKEDSQYDTIKQTYDIVTKKK